VPVPVPVPVTVRGQVPGPVQEPARELEPVAESEPGQESVLSLGSRSKWVQMPESEPRPAQAQATGPLRPVPAQGLGGVPTQQLGPEQEP